MTMNFIGSKQKLSDFIFKSIQSNVQKLKNKVFCDIFAGTGAVSKIFKPYVKQVICNDIEPFSYILLRNYIGNTVFFKYKDRFKELRDLNGVEGFIFKHYCMGGDTERQYFSDENGKKIDAVRQRIEQWRNSNSITEDQYYFFLASLLESADKVANTASVYGAFLKQLKKSAQNEILYKPALSVEKSLVLFNINNTSGDIYQEDANVLIKKLSGDILYLDPPYNGRQYGANYHLLNTIALYDDFIPKGKTGLREYTKSRYCSKAEVEKAFDELIKNADFKHIFLSYNNEGLMSCAKIKDIMSAYGKYCLIEKKYQRFKADKTENRNHKADYTIEYLHVLKRTKRIK